MQYFRALRLVRDLYNRTPDYIRRSGCIEAREAARILIHHPATSKPDLNKAVVLLRKLRIASCPRHDPGR